jgi:hypothetical protein
MNMKRKRRAARSNDESPVGAVSDVVAGQLAAWHALDSKISGSYVTSIASGQDLIDPFLLNAAIAAADALFAPLDPRDKQSYQRLKAWLDTECGTIAQEFEQRLRAFCEHEKIAVEGRFPTFLLDGFLPVEASLANGDCNVNGERRKTLLFDSIAPIILSAIEEDKTRSFDPKSFLEELYHATLRAAAVGGVAASSMLPIMHVFRELVFTRQQPSFFRQPSKKSFNEYGVGLFARDLARILSAGHTITADGRRLDLGPASSSTDGSPLRQDGTLRIVGRVAFRGENEM